ncbi:MAG: HD domain-containing protein [Bacteroidota bacterium]|nr:HD domain-containing protein [Rhodothermia bacterium]MDW8286096.1 HD domain-containing protein [Bacteroidota bacterium]
MPTVQGSAMSRYKLSADPVHGFISIPRGRVLEYVDHPYTQRLRRIRQLGLGFLVFPGAEHSRFQHALGAMALMQEALQTLQEKGTEISPPEHEAALLAALLHDLGHGPFSHVLEAVLLPGFSHERLTRALLERLALRDPELRLTITIFTGAYSRRFLHQLVSSQLDMDRLDYLRRDSFYTGVAEGVIGVERIIKTMRVEAEELVIEQKGVYALENYIIARRLMYWQVYLHKTVLAADKLLLALLERARRLASEHGSALEGLSPALRFFLERPPQELSEEVLEAFVQLDDADVLGAVKRWALGREPVLRDLARRLLERRLFRTIFLDHPPTEAELARWRKAVRRWLRTKGLPDDSDTVSAYLQLDNSQNSAYQLGHEGIWVWYPDGRRVEFSRATDTPAIEVLAHPVVKHYVCLPKEVASDVGLL